MFSKEKEVVGPGPPTSQVKGPAVMGPAQFREKKKICKTTLKFSKSWKGGDHTALSGSEKGEIDAKGETLLQRYGRQKGGGVMGGKRGLTLTISDEEDAPALKFSSRRGEPKRRSLLRARKM